MKHTWDAEQITEPEEALRLIQEQFPEIHAQSISLLGAGWDNTAYLINKEYIFRFPRRQIAVPLLESEGSILPRLAEKLPVPIPIPRWKGSPARNYPWPFLGYRKLPGMTACAANLSDPERTSLAVPLARFLSALHSLPLDLAKECHLPTDTLGRLNMKD